MNYLDQEPVEDSRMRNPAVIDTVLTSAQAGRLLAETANLTMLRAYGHRRRRGAGGVSNLSIYAYCRWDKFSAEMKRLYGELCPSWVRNHYLQVSVLHIPVGGHLDLQTTWKEHTSTASYTWLPGPAGFVSIALHDGQSIIIEGQNYAVPKGCAIAFYPEMAHEIITTTADQHWLVTMLAKQKINEYVASI